MRIIASLRSQLAGASEGAHERRPECVANEEPSHKNQRLETHLSTWFLASLDWWLLATAVSFGSDLVV